MMEIKRAPILLVTLLSGLLVVPAVCRGSGDEFFSCVDKEGRVTVTNRHYDQKLYTCTPFAALNRQFRQAREARPSPVPSRPDTAREASLAAESARMSAQSAAIAMEAASASAEAARQTAEAAQAIAPPFQIIRR